MVHRVARCAEHVLSTFITPPLSQLVEHRQVPSGARGGEQGPSAQQAAAEEVEGELGGAVADEVAVAGESEFLDFGSLF